MSENRAAEMSICTLRRSLRHVWTGRLFVPVFL